MAEDVLIKDIRKALKRRRRQPNAYAGYGLLTNPFPKAGEQTTSPSYDQREANRIFRRKLVAFVELRGERSDRLFVYGDHRVGKTNFLLHSKYVVDTLESAGDIEGFDAVYVPEPGDKYMTFHATLVDRLAENAIPSLLSQLSRDGPARDLEGVTALLASVLSHLIGLDDLGDQHIRLFSKWLRGEKCGITEQRQLGGPASNVTTASLATKVLWELLNLMRMEGTLRGLVVFLDEFELIFSATLSTPKRARYIQDLRHFIDVFQKGIFLVVASLPGVQPQLLREYPALRNRLGKPRELTEIRDEQEARDYAQAYLGDGRARYAEANPGEEQRQFDTLLTDQEVTEAFERVKEEQGKVLQGPFYDELYRITEAKVTSS